MCLFGFLTYLSFLGSGPVGDDDLDGIWGNALNFLSVLLLLPACLPFTLETIPYASSFLLPLKPNKLSVSAAPEALEIACKTRPVAFEVPYDALYPFFVAVKPLPN